MKNLNRYVLAVAAIALTFTSCKKEEDKTETPNPVPTQKTIVGIATGDTTFSILVEALKKAGLVATLDGTGNFTVFAPTNKAFRDLGISAKLIQEMTDPADIADLKDILMYHVLGSEVKSTQLSNTYVPTLYTVKGNGVSLKVNVAPVKLNATTNVITADVDASNGIIHIVDEVLLPPTVVDIASMDPQFSSLVGAVSKAELVGTLEDGDNLTVFAPLNSAFGAINFDLSKFIKEQLTPILTAHVLGTQVRSNQIKNGDKVTTLNSKVELTFNTSSGVKFNGGQTLDVGVTSPDIQATNGVVHVINKVVLPN